jgi:hypothetical protein
MEQSSSCEAHSRPARREIPRLLWNSILHNRVLNSPQLNSILSQMNPNHPHNNVSTEVRTGPKLPTAYRIQMADNNSHLGLLYDVYRHLSIFSNVVYDTFYIYYTSI